MTLDGYRVGLTPITLAQTTNTQHQNSQDETKNNITKTYNQNNSKQITTNKTQIIQQKPVVNPPQQQFSQNNNNFDINSLINSYPGIKQSQIQSTATTTTTTTPTTSNLPSLTSPFPHLSQQQKQNNQVFQEQINVQQNIANFIISLQRKNKQIQNLAYIIILLEAQIQQAKNTSFQCSIELFNITNILTKINNAIEDKITRKQQSEKLIDSNLKRADLVITQLRILQLQKLAYLRKIKPQGNQLIALQFLHTQCQKQKILPSSQIEQKSSQITKNKIQINVISSQIQQSQIRLQKINSSIILIEAKINDLKQQLAKAQQQKQSLLNDKQFYSQIPKQGSQKIKNYTEINTKINKQISDLMLIIEEKDRKCFNYSSRIDKLKIAIKKKEEMYDILDQQSKKKEKQNQVILKQINILRERYQLFSVQIQALNTQLNKYSIRERQQQYLCTLNEASVAQSIGSLNQQKEKYIALVKMKEQIEKGLDQARRKKEEVDKVVEEVIRENTDTLPFSIVPNGGSSVLGGNPLGNNPSGSALGAGFRVDAKSPGVPHPVQGGNISAYLSTVYDMNIDPKNLFPSPSNQTTFKQHKSLPEKQKQQTYLSYIQQLNTNATLYPIDPNSKNKILTASTTNTVSNFNCFSPTAAPTPPKTIKIQGILTKVGVGSLQIRDRLNKKYTLSISTCTTIASTKPTNFFTIGNKIFFSGILAYQFNNIRLYNAYSILIIPI